ncbi:hypothetical protein PVAP13_1NG291619 [Panicum virgatum]|uniref:Uncharacterized protein n=1 Tax=Panicum virgatum TaxID=38727 RepID=A0A8T0WYV3_PANVG|nr:hypothetical protein PVAP13_1NG291619 [Panicum virgatum]
MEASAVAATSAVCDAERAARHRPDASGPRRIAASAPALSPLPLPWSWSAMYSPTGRAGGSARCTISPSPRGSAPRHGQPSQRLAQLAARLASSSPHRGRVLPVTPHRCSAY